ncbi:unnamed protein product [Pocillopora meandrina]|uniref:Uncharacterized protein n=1 Tax=Pocillopora meandrina TaxID=46732 RepID=A0AAU9X3N3_9CNID|nr:unnamed protein product [Pocillopora meandrina]
MREMDEDEPVAKRACLGCEDDYIMDMYSLVQPGQQSQLYLYLTKSGGQSRKTFLQEEQSRLGMMRVHVDGFCMKEKEARSIIAELKTGDFGAVKRIERIKIDQFTLPEKLTYTLPHGRVASLKISVKLTSERDELLLETEQLEVNLPSTHLIETKPAVEHGNNPE